MFFRYSYYVTNAYIVVVVLIRELYNVTNLLPNVKHTRLKYKRKYVIFFIDEVYRRQCASRKLYLYVSVWFSTYYPPRIRYVRFQFKRRSRGLYSLLIVSTK